MPLSISHSTYRRSSASSILSAASRGTIFGTKMPLRLFVMASNPPTTRWLESLAEHLANHARRLTINQTLFATGVVKHELLVIDTKLMKNRGLIIIRRDYIINCLMAELVGLAEG